MPAQNILSTNSVAYAVPLTSQNQEFDISLAGVTYHFRILWNRMSQCWILDVEDVQQNPILTGVPLVLGCDLFEQFGYLAFNGALILQSGGAPDVAPDDTSLGVVDNLYFVIPTAGNT
jgi:hypothetical protein